jgi:maltose alpha-D-glucosyltransferase/alpha-amylase
MEGIAMIPTVNLTGGWETVMEGAARAELERAVVPGFLQQQRWFGGKGRRIEAVQFVDWGDLPATEKRVFAVLMEVRFADGKSDLYFLPLGVSAGEAAERMHRSLQTWLIACLHGPQGEAFLHDALADVDTCMSLITAIGQKREFATRGGRICAFPTAAFSSLAGAAAEKLEVERGPAKSSNSLIIYGQRLMLKLFRRLESGINPEFEIGRFLTESGVFQRIPHAGGAIEYHRAGSEPITLAFLQSFVANDGDGWQHVLEELGHYYERAAERKSAPDSMPGDDRPLLERAELPLPPTVREVIGAYLDAAGLLGRRTAELHHALAADRSHPDFAPEPIAAEDASVLRQSIRTQSENALAALRDNFDQIPKHVAPLARQLLERGREGLPQWEQQGPIRARAVKIRCHGDYHLAQVLRVENDYVIIDFEGEPTRTVAERRQKHSPLKDVAGMLRSYHYAAYAGLFDFTRDRPDDFGRLQPWAELWFRWTSAAFLRDYRAGVRSEDFLPADTAAFAEVLDAFMLDKMFYELNYELNNRPDWVGIPLRSILVQLKPAEPRP